ncbi:glycosyltransferase family 4 protein [Rhodohalobacter sp. 614A]|uniref:glycosyltransferase family 4 protein n=1 Tax=Rhodohalobacter sp. 614A TaxID=2908649 RepID=UPI001F476829|nr:glycosyltransferase family 4 protein [Rhodohalobacter sp. 614A]
MSRVYIVSSILPPTFSGAGIRALRTAKNLSDKYNVSLITETSKVETDLQTVVIKGLSGYKKDHIVFLLVKYFFIFFITPLSIFNQLRKIEEPDLIHCFSVTWLGIYVYWYNKIFWNAPILFEVTLLGSDTIDAKNKWWIYRKISDYCLKTADQINAISLRLYQDLLKKGLDKEKISLISNSVDIDRFKPISKYQRSINKGNYNINSDTFVIITTAGVSKRKGYLLLKDIVKSLPSDFNYHWFFVGDYSRRKKRDLMNYILNDFKKNNIDQNVTFTGYTDPVSYLRMSDLFVFTSEREGFGTVIIEAMSSGLPIICKKIEGITDFILKNNSGVIIDSNDPNDFVEEILKVKDDEKLAEEMGKNAVNVVKNRFSLEIIIKEYDELYQSLIT